MAAPSWMYIFAVLSELQRPRSMTLDKSPDSGNSCVAPPRLRLQGDRAKCLQPICWSPARNKSWKAR
eukprot:1805092-Pyramimonas_sp.AAC.1